MPERPKLSTLKKKSTCKYSKISRQPLSIWLGLSRNHWFLDKLNSFMWKSITKSASQWESWVVGFWRLQNYDHTILRDLCGKRDFSAPLPPSFWVKIIWNLLISLQCGSETSHSDLWRNIYLELLCFVVTNCASEWKNGWNSIAAIFG